MPVAIESLGTFGARSLKFIRDLGRRIALQSGDPLATTYLIQRLAVTVQRGNAASIIGTIGLLADWLSFLCVLVSCSLACFCFVVHWNIMTSLRIKKKGGGVTFCCVEWHTHIYSLSSSTLQVQNWIIWTLWHLQNRMVLAKLKLSNELECMSISLWNDLWYLDGCSCIY